MSLNPAHTEEIRQVILSEKPAEGEEYQGQRQNPPIASAQELRMRLKAAGGETSLLISCLGWETSSVARPRPTSGKRVEKTRFQHIRTYPGNGNAMLGSA